MLRLMLSQAFSIGGPVAIRYPRDTVVEAPLPCPGFMVGRAQILQPGTRAVVFCAGPGCYRILEACRDIDGVAVVDLCSAKPLDRGAIIDLVCAASGRFVVVEDGTAQGGIGSAVLEVLSGLDLPLTFRLLGIPDRFVEHGGSERLRAQLGLDAQGIVAAIRDIL